MIILLYLLLLFVLISEIILKINNTAGVIFYGIFLIGILMSVSFSKNFGKIQEFLLVFMIFPLIKIADSFLLIYVPWRAELISLIVLILGIYYIWKFKVDLGSINKILWLIPLVIILGISLGILGNYLFSIKAASYVLAILPIAILSEEIFFRGLLMNLIDSKINAIIFVSLIIGIVNINFGIVPALFLVFVNFIICLIYSSTRNLILGYLLNLFVNISIILPNIYY